MNTASHDVVRARLEAEKRRLDDEIRSYPTPIPRCDAQFNHLYERRQQIIRELEGFEAKA